MANPERGEVQLGKYVLKFEHTDLKLLEDHFGLNSYAELFNKVANLNALTKIVSVGAKITEDIVDKIDLPILKMTNKTVTALSLVIFGTPEPPEVDEEDPT